MRNGGGEEVVTSGPKALKVPRLTSVLRQVGGYHIAHDCGLLSSVLIPQTISPPQEKFYRRGSARLPDELAHQLMAM